MDFFRISKPDQSHVNLSTLLDRYQIHRDKIRRYADSITYPEYLPWEKARFISPPDNFSKEEAWFLGRVGRSGSAEPLPIKTQQGGHFVWTRLRYTDRYLNEFDMYMGGHQVFSNKVRLSSSEQQSYMTRGIIEEAIASSQLEGASVTRKDAKAMIAENRTPRDKSEWMTFNNYRMMVKTTELYKEVPLSRELLLEMHQLIAANTMPEDEIGRWRLNSDNVVVGSDTITAYIPPKEDFLAKELDALIKFANDDDPDHFMHPIIKAIVLHFWIGYLHPFVDGNGRIARAIFYWYLLKKGYWLATYVPISTVIKRAPIQYGNAYVYAEQDNDDFTYFFDYHMRKIKKALDEFLKYVEKQKTENQDIDRLLDSKAQLNERQKQVMHYLISSQHHRVSITSHSALNNISTNTARSDLIGLRKLGLIFPLRSGKFIYFYAKPLS